MNIGGPELLVVVLLVAVTLPIISLVDIVSKPAWAFEEAGQSRTMFVVFAALGIPLCGLGVLVAAVWFLGVRPRVVAAVDATSPDT